MSEHVQAQLRAAAELLARIAESEADRVEQATAVIVEAVQGGGRILTAGNGGSASDAEHLATELSGRFYLDRPGVDCLALTANGSAVTAIGNDFGFEELFARQVEAHGRPGDVLVLFTTSGRSANVRRARERGAERGLAVIGFTGEAGRSFADACDIGFVVPSTDTPRIQEAHIALAHVLCERVEARLFGEGS